MAGPIFRYHPDPVATGSAASTGAACSLCGIQRGIRYTGPVYGAQPEPETLCLHCIHSGEASQRLGNAERPAQFSDAINVPDDVPIEIVEEVTQRTPGFTGWQQEQWMFHCADAAAFLGPAGCAELGPHPGALAMLRQDCDSEGWPAEQTETFLSSLDRRGQPTAYLFRCLHCGTHLAYWDIA